MKDLLRKLFFSDRELMHSGSALDGVRIVTSLDLGWSSVLGAGPQARDLNTLFQIKWEVVIFVQGRALYPDVDPLSNTTISVLLQIASVTKSPVGDTSFLSPKLYPKLSVNKHYILYITWIDDSTPRFH